MRAIRLDRLDHHHRRPREGLATRGSALASAESSSYPLPRMAKRCSLAPGALQTWRSSLRTSPHHENRRRPARKVHQSPVRPPTSEASDRPHQQTQPHHHHGSSHAYPARPSPAFLPRSGGQTRDAVFWSHGECAGDPGPGKSGAAVRSTSGRSEGHRGSCPRAQTSPHQVADPPRRTARVRVGMPALALCEAYDCRATRCEGGQKREGTMKPPRLLHGHTCCLQTSLEGDQRRSCHHRPSVWAVQSAAVASCPPSRSLL